MPKHHFENYGKKSSYPSDEDSATFSLGLYMEGFFGGEVFQNHFEPGVYVCAKCSYELFSSHSKYAHSSPWPAFTETIHPDSVTKCPEKNRPEALKVSCGKCGNGLGHEFLNDGPKRGQSRF